MSEENKNRCPKCDKGRLKQLEYRATESIGRKRYSLNARVCQLCKTIVSADSEISFVDASNGIQFH